MRLLLGRALNRNQILILFEIYSNSNKTITGTLSRISRMQGVPLSTLKLNAKILRDIGSVSYSEFRYVELMEFGKAIIKLLT